MFGTYNFKKNEFVCSDSTTADTDDLVFKLKGRLFCEDKEKILKQIIEKYDDLEFFNKLNGQFAIAIYNKKEKKLLLIRDHFGVIPLYYCSSIGKVFFGTEIESILKEKEHRIEVNKNVIHEYLAFRYISGAGTIFKNIYEVKPGTIITIDEQGRITEKQYYRPDYSQKHNYKDKSDEELFQKTFWESLKLQTFDRDEKKIGVLSSGGIDSSILVSCGSKILAPGFNTYYIGNEGYKYNKTDDVNSLSLICNTQHKNLFASGTIFADSLIETIRINEEPLNHPSSVLRYYLNTQIKDEVDVLLSGEGADCLYCGYYIFDLIKYFYVKNPVRPFTRFLAGLLPVSLAPTEYKSRVQKVLNAFLLPPDKYTIFYSDLISLNPEIVKLILDFRSPDDFSGNYYSTLSEYNSKNILNLILSIYQGDYIVEALKSLSKFGDACGLEFRHPFIDTGLVNFFNQFPWNDKIKFFKRKHQIVELGKKHLPDEFFNKRKEGFGVPLKDWFYEKNGPARFIELLVDKKTRERGVFNPTYLDKLITLYRDKTMPGESFETVLWPIINLELWFRIFIDNNVNGYS